MKTAISFTGFAILGGLSLWFLVDGGGGRVGEMLAKFFLVGVSIFLWHQSQALLSIRGFPQQGIGDMFHLWTRGAHAWLSGKPEICRWLLIWSSLGIDIIGIFLVGFAIFGDSMAPFLAVVFLFTMRQLSQSLCSLPPPEGMIWLDPRVPSLLVTYKTCNDFFFSGHTAIACLGAIFAWQYLPVWAAVGVSIAAVGEATLVLVFRAHYTMDVICAVLASVVSYSAAVKLCAVYGI